MYEDAKKRALRLLERRDYGRDELVHKLMEKGESAEDAAAVADRMVELGFINDESYAVRVARHYAARGFGPARVRTELLRRRLPRDYWDAALETLPERDESLDRLLARRLKSDAPDRDEYRRAADALIRRGFAWDEVREAVARARAERGQDE